MKGAALFIAFFALLLLIVPMIAIGFDTALNEGVSVHTPSSQASAPAAAVWSDSVDEAEGPEETIVAEAEDARRDEAIPTISGNGVLSFDILNQSTGEVETVALRDFVRGAVAAEMPASFHPEALKAQAVAAHTFALHNHLVQQETPAPALNGADFAADPDNMLVYITEQKAREFYGDNADLYWDKICKAADSVVSYVLEYEEEPIVAAYHAISSGVTEDAANIWSGSAPYLVAVESEGDLLAPNYETVVTFSEADVRNALETACPDAELPADPGSWFTDIRRSASGYITSADVGGVELHGKDIRALFDLRSHNIDIEYSGDSGIFTFTVYGYGHGVGLSQYGADFLARQGYTFDEILNSYYTGVTLMQIAPSGSGA